MNDGIESIKCSLFYKINTCIEHFHCCCPGGKNDANHLVQ